MIKVLLFHEDGYNDNDNDDDNDNDNDNDNGNANNKNNSATNKYNDKYPCCRVAAAACLRCPQALQAWTSHVHSLLMQ